jgi:hypothetical protein
MVLLVLDSHVPGKFTPQTFSDETRSAVSSRVNLLIWLTISAILGLLGAAAASVDCHLRDWMSLAL